MLVVKLVVLVPGLSHQMTLYYDAAFDIILCTERSLLHQVDQVISGLSDSKEKIHHDAFGSIGIG